MRVPGHGPAVRLADGRVAALRPLDPAAPWLPAWRALSRRPFVENLFYDPDFALAALDAFGDGVEVLLVGDRPPEEPGLRLVAVWPCRRRRGRWGLPLRLTMGWMHGFGVFGVPLLDPDAPDRALDGLLRGAGRLAGPRLMLTYVPMEGPFADLLARSCRSHGLARAEFWAHARAVLDLSDRTGPERAAYLDHLSSRRRRRLRQSAERLAPLDFETIRDPAVLRAALDDYIALEGIGWKGRAGTAIGDTPGEIALLHASVAAFGARGRVRIDRLRRDGTTLASAVTFVTGKRAWCVKISFLEAEARDSPGAQLVHQMTRSLIADTALSGADSCAPPDFRLAETFWAERMPLAHVLVAAPGGDRLFGLARRLEGLRARVSRMLARRTWARGRTGARAAGAPDAPTSRSD
ncbi:GNAT family N-acetyltransferase [Methylobacterium sp. J-090]|uniref:GNAT family N-acetyltransferase n=1 Tax=Methylobacterium sp. J-090 TaxID=2836666 RepID=UPI001FBB7C65|nr:GNAT family N-acetyltransferase [Methylobacterium sp. J-090]MCJ2081083.1 GNAT family N-acetyltransferase [Methylobacterium sp. J-090]